jgi:hypothetical protein
LIKAGAYKIKQRKNNGYTNLGYLWGKLVQEIKSFYPKVFVHFGKLQSSLIIADKAYQGLQI